MKLTTFQGISRLAVMIEKVENLNILNMENSIKKGFTYLGSFDDRVLLYEDSNKFNIKTLNEILVSEMLFSTNSNVLINDGYIVNSPIFRKVLFAKKEEPAFDSPLFSMIENGFVSVLAREHKSLVSMVQKMVDEKNKSFVDFAQTDNWIRPLQKFDELLKNKFLEWPKKDVSTGFVKLMHELFKKKPNEIGLTISAAEFDKIANEFDKTIAEENKGSRDKWEKIIDEHEKKSELMAIANRAYHYNFGMCIQAENNNNNVYVNSIASNLFSNKIAKLQESDCDFEKLNFKVPNKIRINCDFIKALRNPHNSLSAAHDYFIQGNNKFINGGEHADLIKSQKEFKKAIINFDKDNATGDKNSSLDFILQIIYAGSFGAIAGALGGPVVGAITSIAGFLVPEGVDSLKQQYRYVGKKNYTYPKKRTFIDSLKISNEEAKKHVNGLKDFK